MRLNDLLSFGAEELKAVGIEENDLDARLLLEYCSGMSRTEIYLNGKKIVNSKIEGVYFDLLKRRKQREPIAYIIGEQEFWSLPFYVMSDVLIPRPETEFLLDRVFALVDQKNLRSSEILDLCCGSGVIAIVLAKETGKTVTAVDLSLKALEVCKKNCNRHSVTDLVEPLQGDLLSQFCGNKMFSLIVSNPPYIRSADIANSLAPEVADNEPHMALDGGEDGLDHIKRIRLDLSKVLRPGGQFFMEIGADQGRAVSDLFCLEYKGTPRFSEVKILKDYAGRDRVLYSQL